MQYDRKTLRRSSRQRRSGSELVEFSLVLLPFLAFMTLILNLGWVVFVQATLQYAVAQGGRYAVTNPSLNGMGQRASIQTFVQQNSIGLLRKTPGLATGANGWNYIYVDWYTCDAAGTLTPLDSLVDTSSNPAWTNAVKALPLVEVSVRNVPGIFMMQFIRIPGLGTLNPIPATAVSWDRMGGPPIDSTGKIVVPPI